MQNNRYPMIKSEGDRVWQKYCGFLDLSLQQFMSIQESLLLQQLVQMSGCPLAEKLIGRKMPRNIEEFRRAVPLTTYEDYLPELSHGDDIALPEKTYVWSSTISGSSVPKMVPYTRRAYNSILENLMSVFILSCSQRKGESSIADGDRVLFNVAPTPYISGILAAGASELFNLRPVIPPDEHDSMEFKEKMTRGFEVSLRTGVDILIAMTSVLVKTGNDFNRLSRKSRISRYFLHPGELYRITKAFLCSKLDNRKMLPKDLWPVKALIGWGIDTSVYREQVYRHWGAYPYEFHACTEAGIMAVQSWTRKDLTFIPHSNFYEFIPEAEWQKSRDDSFYEPSTVLLSEVKPGERYELVITSFNSMPFVRYRLGHLVRITEVADEEAGICLPQMRFETRADDLIDIAGFTRVSEMSVTQAIANTGLAYEDWVVRKDMEDGKPVLHIYIESSDAIAQAELAEAIHRELMNVDEGYRDLAGMMGIYPCRVTLLKRDTFKNYYQRKLESGAALARRRPPRMNPDEDIISELVGLEEKAAAPVR